jgi:hypothetical protein
MPFPPPPADTAATLARLGRRLRWLVLLYLVIVVAGLTATTLLWPALLAYQPALVGLGLDPAALGPGGRLAACAALALPALPLFAAIRQALLLCRLVSSGQVFTAEVPRRLRRMCLGPSSRQCGVDRPSIVTVDFHRNLSPGSRRIERGAERARAGGAEAEAAP